MFKTKSFVAATLVSLVSAGDYGFDFVASSDLAGDPAATASCLQCALAGKNPCIITDKAYLSLTDTSTGFTCEDDEADCTAVNSAYTSLFPTLLTETPDDATNTYMSALLKCPQATAVCGGTDG
jgi:hypothetical protein